MNATHGTSEVPTIYVYLTAAKWLSAGRWCLGIQQVHCKLFSSFTGQWEHLPRPVRMESARMNLN